MMGSFTMRPMIVLALIGFALSVDVCVDYSRSDYCTEYAPNYCRYNRVNKFCPVTCGKCTQPAPVPNGQSLKDDCLAAFNAKRQLHQQTPDLVWDGVAEAQAQAVVDSSNAPRRFCRRFRRRFRSRFRSPFCFGRNNYYGTANYIYRITGNMPSNEELCKKAVDRWYKRSENYDYSNPRYGGSFTQLIWKSTTKVGVGISIKKFRRRTLAYIIAHFYRAGNNRKTYSTNVMPLKSGITTIQPPTTPTRTTTTKITPTTTPPPTTPQETTPPPTTPQETTPPPTTPQETTPPPTTPQETTQPPTTPQETTPPPTTPQETTPPPTTPQETTPPPTTPQETTPPPTTPQETTPPQTTPQETTPPQTTPQETPPPPLNDFENACLKSHNDYRDLHQGTDKLLYDSTIAKTAQIYAQYMADNDFFDHEKNIPYGENLASYSGPVRDDTIEAEDSTKRWYDEIKDYNYNNPGFSMLTGHFTQVVWKNSKRLGCGIARKGRKIYVVARYDPPGNFRDQFSGNVAPLE